MTDFEKLITAGFHVDFFDKLHELNEFYSGLLNKESHLLIDARDFPNLNVKVLHPKDLLAYVPKNHIYEYMTYSIAYESIALYLYNDDNCFLYCQENSEEDSLQKINHAQDETNAYLRAYENGLLKEIYLQAKNSDKFLVFGVLNGEAKILSVEEAEKLINDYSDYFPDIEEWKILNTEEEINPSKVSFLYIDTEKEIYWFDILSEEYEEFLFKKWGFEC